MDVGFDQPAGCGRHQAFERNAGPAHERVGPDDGAIVGTHEHVLSSHPDVLMSPRSACLIRAGGEAVKAVVVRRPGTSTDEASLVGFCRGKLGGFKIPKSVDFIDALPRNASGKIQKVILRDRYWAGHARKI